MDEEAWQFFVFVEVLKNILKFRNVFYALNHSDGALTKQEPFCIISCIF